MASLSGIPSAPGTGSVSPDRCPVAHSRRSPQHRWGGRPRIFLVLFRQRAFPALSGKALSARLQQATLGAVLVSASGVAVSMEPVLTGCNSNHGGRAPPEAR